MNELFVQFLKSPNKESYTAIREAITASEFYQPYSRELDDIDELMEKGSLDAVKDKIRAAMPNLLLSPRVHLLLSFLAEKQGDSKTAEMEGYIAATCCEGILSTGDGSREAPYFILRTSDEHDLLRYLDKRFTGQSLIHDGDRHFDHITCEDGSDFWIDITSVFGQMGQIFRKNNLPAPKTGVEKFHSLFKPR